MAKRGRKPSKDVDVVELELLMGHGSFKEFAAAVAASLGREMNEGSLRVYWGHHRRFGPRWRRVMRRTAASSFAARVQEVLREEAALEAMLC